MPVQLLFGERDAVLHARKSIDALKSAVPQSETYLLPDAGHVLVGHTERIEEFLRRIEGKI
jgi:pimeloyl-ACP methyl ester carboxylesterase